MIACIAVSKTTERKFRRKTIVQVWQVHFLLGVEIAITEIISPEFIFI